MATGALGACVVQEALADGLLDRVRTVKAGGVGLLDLDGPAAAAAADPAAASFSICFAVGIRQLAGRSVIERLEHIMNNRVEPVESRKAKNR